MNIAASIPTVSADVICVTPKLAKEMLGKSIGNRNLKAAKVDSLVRDMVAGKYKLNGESIIFSSDGRLMDGHHRLTACHKSNVPIYTVVVTGIDMGASKTQDTGASRTTGDHLALSGVKNSNNISAITSCLLSLKAGRPRSANPSSSEVFEFMENHPEIEAAASFASTKAYPRASNILGAIYFVATQQGERERAIAFRDVFATGVPAYSGCPAHLLRERLNKNAIKGEKLPLAGVQRLFVAAWEKFRLHKSVKTLKAPSEYKITGWSQQAEQNANGT